MPLLAVGTTNPGKVAAVRDALASYPALSGWTPSPQKVSSGVSDQPKTLAETTQGARNRAERAAAAAGADAFGIGMESGLFESEGRLFDVCACAIFDGKEMHIGYSCAWELPPAVQEKVVKEGMDLTQAFNACKVCNDPNIGDKGGVIGLLSGGRVSRPDYTRQSIEMAILALNPDHYKCSAAVPAGINDAPEAEGPLRMVGYLVAAAAVIAVGAAVLKSGSTTAAAPSIAETQQELGKFLN